MTKIKVEINGTVVEIEVTETFAMQYAQMESKDKNVERKETRRHQSLELSMEAGFDFEDKNAINPEEEMLKKEQGKRYRKILKYTYKQLTPEQKILFKRVILGKEKQCDVAEEMGIAKQSMSDRIIRIKSRFEKNLKLFLK